MESNALMWTNVPFRITHVRLTHVLPASIRLVVITVELVHLVTEETAKPAKGSVPVLIDHAIHRPIAQMILTISTLVDSRANAQKDIWETVLDLMAAGKVIRQFAVRMEDVLMEDLAR